MNLDRVLAVRTGRIVYRDAEDCIKVFDRDYSAAEVLGEALNQARAEALGLHVPRLRSVTVLDGKWAIISEYIRGKTLAERMSELPERSTEQLSLLSELQCMLHGQEPPLSLPRQREQLAAAISRSEVAAPVQEKLLCRLSEPPEEHCFCHGELEPTNVILTWGGVPYIVDWSHACIGSPATDAARSCLYFRLSAQPEAEAAYLSLFCQQSHIAPEDVRCRIPLVAAALSVVAPLDRRRQLLQLAQQEL